MLFKYYERLCLFLFKRLSKLTMCEYEKIIKKTNERNKETGFRQ